MKNINLVVCFLIASAICSCSFQSRKLINNTTTLVEVLHKIPKKKQCNAFSDLWYKYTSQVKNELSFINYNHDTLFMIDDYDDLIDKYYQSIWTNNGKLEYAGRDNHVDIQIDRPLFTQGLYELVDKWDIEKIEYNSNNSSIEHGGTIMTCSRVIIKDGMIQVDCLQFKSFRDVGLFNY